MKNTMSLGEAQDKVEKAVLNKLENSHPNRQFYTRIDTPNGEIIVYERRQGIIGQVLDFVLPKAIARLFYSPSYAYATSFRREIVVDSVLTSTLREVYDEEERRHSF